MMIQQHIPLFNYSDTRIVNQFAFADDWLLTALVVLTDWPVTALVVLTAGAGSLVTALVVLTAGAGLIPIMLSAFDNRLSTNIFGAATRVVHAAI